MQQSVSTSSADIAASRERILAQLRKDPGYAAALEANAARQRQAEAAWLDDEGFSEARVVACAAASAGEPPGGCAPAEAAAVLARHGLHGGAAPRAALAGGAKISAALDIVSYDAKHALWDEAVVLVGGDAPPPGGAPAGRLPLLLKSPVGDNEASVADLRHEAVIGIFGTNAFRQFIPNFPVVYAYIAASESAAPRGAACETAARAGPSRAPASPRRKRGAAREQRGATPSLLVEDICQPAGAAPAPLSEAIAHLAPADFYAVLFQVSFALKFAHDRTGFTHYDLHADNVLLRAPRAGADDVLLRAPRAGADDVMLRAEDTQPPALFYIPYEAGRVFVAARWVATIVDLGFAHAMLRNSAGRQIPFGFAAPGRASLVELGVFRDRPNPMTDIYRLLITSGVAAAAAHKTAAEGGDAAAASRCAAVLAEIGKLARYFNQTETLDEIVERQRESFYYLPLTPQARAYGFDDFVAFAKREARASKLWDARAPLVTSAPPRRAEVLLAGSGFVGGAQFALQAEPISVFCVPQTFVGFFDMHAALIARLEGEDRREAVRALTRGYMKGYTENKAAFNRSAESARERAAALGARAAACARGFSASADVEVRRARAAGAVAALRMLAETRRAAEYAVALYWPGKARQGEDAPEEVRAVLDGLAAELALAAAAVAALGADVASIGDANVARAHEELGAA